MRLATTAIVTALVREQQGLATRAQLLEAGLDVTTIRRELAAGRWHRLVSGIYLTAPGPADAVLLQRAALLYAGPGSALCGPTAAHLHRLRDVPATSAVHVLLPVTRRRAPAGGLVLHRTRHAPGTQVAGGMPVTTVPRCVVESARWCGSLQDARAVVTASVGDRRATVEQLAAELARSPQQGSANARRAIRDARVGARSAPEAEVSDLAERLARSGHLPPFLLNPEVWLGDVLLGIPDLWVPSLGFGHETDSVQFHGSADDLDGTLDRHEGFADAGLPLLHTSPRRMRRDPGALEQRLMTKAREQRARPEGLRVVPKGPLLPENL